MDGIVSEYEPMALYFSLFDGTPALSSCLPTNLFSRNRTSACSSTKKRDSRTRAIPSDVDSGGMSSDRNSGTTYCKYIVTNKTRPYETCKDTQSKVRRLNASINNFHRHYLLLFIIKSTIIYFLFI